MDLILVLIALSITFIAQIILNATYQRYKNVELDLDISGCEVAKRILSEYDLYDIRIGKVSGNLSDHYNNTRRVINLSRDIFDGHTIASAAVAAHECGHAIQYKEGYLPIKIRNMLVPFVNFGNSIGYLIIVISLASSITKLFLIGIALISFALIFQIVTLPVEFDASKRANKILLELGIVTENEQEGTKRMLKAAAFTYVAGLISSITQILRLVLAFSNSRNKD